MRELDQLRYGLTHVVQAAVVGLVGLIREGGVVHRFEAHVAVQPQELLLHRTPDLRRERRLPAGDTEVEQALRRHQAGDQHE
ncbi:hypothetical protein GCM10020000_81740 [Streptomyces olivoverticillatus]